MEYHPGKGKNLQVQHEKVKRSSKLPQIDLIHRPGGSSGRTVLTALLSKVCTNKVKMNNPPAKKKKNDCKKINLQIYSQVRTESTKKRDKSGGL